MIERVNKKKCPYWTSSGYDSNGDEADSLEMKLIHWHLMFACHHTTKLMQLNFQPNDISHYRVGGRCFKVHEEPKILLHLEKLRHAGLRMVWTCGRLEVHRPRNTNFQWQPLLGLLASWLWKVCWPGGVASKQVRDGIWSTNFLNPWVS